MPIKSLLYVLTEVGAPLSLVEAELDHLGDHDCLVDILYTSVCGTQLGEMRGTRGPDRFLPHCMGHEGMGKIRMMGSSVERFRLGDIVYLTWIPCDERPAAGKKHLCTANGQLINSGPVVSFARSMVCSASRLFSVSKSLFGDKIPCEALTPLGCAYATAYGMVKRTANLSSVDKSEPIAVVGMGGVGLATALFLALAGYKSVVIFELDQARKMTALRLINDIGGCIAMEGCPSEVTAGYARVFECTGSVAGTELSYRLTSMNGVCVLSGNVPFGAKILIDPFDILLGKRIVGSGIANSIPQEDFPEIETIINANLTIFESLVTTGYQFEDLNEAIFDFEFNSVQRPIIRCA